MTIQSALKEYAEQVDAFRRERIRHEQAIAELEIEYNIMCQELYRRDGA